MRSSRLGLLSFAWVLLGTSCGGGDGESQCAPEAGFQDVVAGACVSALPESPAIAECQTQLCAPASMRVVATDACQGPSLLFSGSGAGADGPFIAYTYNSPQLFLYVSFRASSIAEVTSESALGYVWMNVAIPQGRDFYYQTPALRGTGPWQSLAIRDGRIAGSMAITLPRISRRVDSQDPLCVSDDIRGECACVYPPQPVDAVVEVDLALPAS